ncbi:MAG: RNA polymerase sigma factor, partial [Planctomycetota bacterium]
SGDQLAFDDAVVAALGGLEPTARACLLLKTVHGHSYAEIGQMLGVPEGTAMSHVHRARKRMRETLTERKANEGAKT